jgi:hypothetical protein
VAGREESSRSVAGGEEPTVVRLVAEESGENHRRLFHHLTVAAEEIARREDPAGGSSRFAAAAARFRDLGYGPRREGVGPVVTIEDGAVVPLSDLLASAWLRERRSFPGPGIDSEMLEAARQLLLELAWRMPNP